MAKRNRWTESSSRPATVLKIALVVARIALAAVAALALGGLVFLALGVRGEPAVELDPEVLARAKSQYERRNKVVAPPAAPAIEAPEPAPPAEPSQPVERWRPKPIPPIPQPKAAPSLPEVGPGSEFNEQMDEANQAYDQERYEEAIERARGLLEVRPRNARMLRIMVSANCILGNADEAGRWYDELPMGRHRRDMATRCRRYDVELD